MPRKLRSAPLSSSLILTADWRYPLDYNFDIDAKVEKSDNVKNSLKTMLLIVHQFAVTKLDKNFGIEEELRLQQEGFKEGFDDERVWYRS